MVDNGETNGSSDASIPNPPQIEHALSITSRKYDVDGDGKLDEAERALRDMDTGNVGHLSNAKVYELMREQIRLQNTNVTQRKLIIGLSCFAVVLALANMGTAFAAARLAQDATLSGPPEGATGSGTDQRRLSTTGNPVREPWANGMPEDTLLSKRDSGIVGTKQVAATQVTLDLQTRSDEVTPGPDDANLQGAPFACLPLSRVSDMYNRITEGSTASVIANNPNADPALGEMQRSVETLGKAGVSGTKVTFYSPGSTNPSLYIPLGDDICDRPVDRRRTLRTSERRRLARARTVKDMFNRLTHSNPMLRKEAERFLGDGHTDADFLEDALGLEPSSDPVPGEPSDADWLSEQLGLNPAIPDTNPLDSLQNPDGSNRGDLLVPVFYWDILPQELPQYTGTDSTGTYSF